MTDEELRLKCVHLAGGDLDLADAVYKFVIREPAPFVEKSPGVGE